VTPKEAGEVELQEPNWRERFETHCARWPGLPRYLAEDNAFEATMRDWRRHHFTWIEVGGKAKRRPAGAQEAIIALAKLRIFPARFLLKEVPRDGACGYQSDDHMWLSLAGEQWRITGVEDRMLHLERRFDEPETRQIDLNRARWTKYTAAAVEALEAMRSPLAETPVTHEGA
jgi:hypothetical protein